MNRTSLALLIFLCMTGTVIADMTYDPVTNQLYTMPESSDINQVEYYYLVMCCFELENRISNVIYDGKDVPHKEFCKQAFHFLKRIGTPTALRLINDFKKNKLVYPDGSVAMKLTD